MKGSSKIRKTIAACVVGAALVVTCAGCSGSNNASTTEDNQQATEKIAEQSTEKTSGQSASKSSSSDDKGAELEKKAESLSARIAKVKTIDTPEVKGGVKLNDLSAPATSDEFKAKVMDAEETFTFLNDKGMATAYSFTLEGDTYTLPCTLKDLFDKGWTTNVEDWGEQGVYKKLPDQLPAENEYSDLSIFRGGKKFDLSYTPANGATDIAGCAVIKIRYSASDQDTKGFAKCEFGKGVTLGSSQEAVLSALGQPYEVSGSTVDGGSHKSDERVERYLASVTYSRTKSLQKLKKDADDLRKEIERYEKSNDGKITLPEFDPVGNTSHNIGSEGTNNDEIKVDFDKDSGQVKEITVKYTFI